MLWWKNQFSKTNISFWITTFPRIWVIPNNVIFYSSPENILRSQVQKEANVQLERVRIIGNAFHCTCIDRINLSEYQGKCFRNWTLFSPHETVWRLLNWNLTRRYILPRGKTNIRIHLPHSGICDIKHSFRLQLLQIRLYNSFI